MALIDIMIRNAKTKEKPELLSKLENYNGEPQTKLALKFLILTFTRTGEVRGARWDEINFDKQEWRIPSERMKMKEQHIVALSSQAMQLLEKLRAINGDSEHLFPSNNKPMQCISEN